MAHASEKFYLPTTQMTLVLIGISALLFGGLTFKIRGQLGSKYCSGYELGNNYK